MSAILLFITMALPPNIILKNEQFMAFIATQSKSFQISALLVSVFGYNNKRKYWFFACLLACLLVLPVPSSANFFSETLFKESSNEAYVAKLLEQAMAARRTDFELSQRYANQALKLATHNNNPNMIGQSHSMLGRLAKDSKDYEKAKEHFSKATVIFRDIGNARREIVDSMEYAKALVSEKNFEEADFAIQALIPIAKRYGEEELVARVLEVRAVIYKKQKRFEEAISVYTEMVTFLSSEEYRIQERLSSVYHELGQIYKKLGDFENTAIFHKYALRVNNTLDDQERIARSLKNVAQAEYKNRNYLIALDYVLRGVEAQKHLDDRQVYAELLVLGGTIYRYLHRYDASLRYMSEAHEIYKLENNIAKIADTSNQIGFLYTRLHEFSEAKTFYEVAIELPEDQVPDKIRASAYREISVIDFETEKYQSALEKAVKAHAIYLANNDTDKGTVSARILGQIYFALGEKAKAFRYLRESVSQAERSGSTLLQVKALNVLGSSLIKENTNLKEAEQVLTRSLQLANESNYELETRASYSGLMKLSRRSGNLQRALNYAEHSIKATEFLCEDREQKKSVFFKSQLDSHRAEADLEMLKRSIEREQLILAQKNNEAELKKKTEELEALRLQKDRYANIALALGLLIVFALAIYALRLFAGGKARS